MSKPATQDLTSKFCESLCEFLTELQAVFPERKDKLQEHMENMKLNPQYYLDWFEVISNKYFSDIASKNEAMFEGAVEVELLPGIDFRALWKCNISGNTKNAIWRYLHVLLLFVFQHGMQTENMNEAFREWDKILDKGELSTERLEEMRTQTERVFQLMQNLATPLTPEEKTPSSDADADADAAAPTPTSDAFMDKLENSNIARLAEELAKDMDPSTAQGIFGKDPKQIMDLVKNVGSKIQGKLSTGEICQEDLLNEAQDLLSSMKDSKAFQNLFQQGTAGNPMDLFANLAKQMGSTGEDEDGGFGGGGGDMMEMMMSMMGSLGTPPSAGAGATRNRLRKKLDDKRKKGK